MIKWYLQVAWQIDPFGHSKEQAFIFSEMGLDGYFFGRLDWRDKSQRVEEKTLEMIWETSADTTSEIFTGINYNYYSPPDYFCWDYWCNDEPIMDDASLSDYNSRQIALDLIEYLERQASHYRSNNILLTMGMDFHYQIAHVWYKNLDITINMSAH